MPIQRGIDDLCQDWIADTGRRLLDQLRRDLRADPDAYGLRDRLPVMGRQFVLTYAVLRDRDGARAGSAVVGDFARHVAGTGTTVVDAVGRRAAVRAGERLFSAPADTLFCLVYRQFFADVVSEFLRAAIAEEINAAVPVLVLVDPAGQVTDWVAARLVALVPDPCAAVVAGRSVLEVAIEHVRVAVDAVLGLGEPA